MNRTKLFFAIMGMVYLLISIMQFIGAISLSSFFVFSLAFSATLISVSDLIIGISEYYTRLFVLHIDLEHTYKIMTPKENTTVILNGVHPNSIKELYEKYCTKHNSENKLKHMSRIVPIMHTVATISFSLGIAVFLIFPFLNNIKIVQKVEYYGNGLTALAFAVMSISLFVREKIEDLNRDMKEINKIHNSSILG